MTHEKNNISKKITIIYSAIQGTYFACIVPYLVFAAVFLRYRGLSNSQIGYSISAAAIGSIVLQMLISGFADRNSKVPLKHIVASMYVVILCVGSALSLIPQPVAVVMVLFIIGQVFAISLNSLLNATFMQLRNTGLAIGFGLPRGVGSLSCAVLSYIFGLVIEAYTPEVLLQLQIVLTVLALMCILLLPKPESVTAKPTKDMHENTKIASLFGMLKGNPTFVVFLLAVIVSSIGQSYFSFLINIIRSVGGNNVDLGLGICINCGVELIPMALSFWLLRRFGSKKLLVFSIITFVLKTSIIAFAANITWVYIGLTTGIFANGIFYFASVYFVNEIVKPDERTRGQALIGMCSFAGVGLVVGGAIDGVLIDHLGLSAMMSFNLACGLFAIVLILFASYLHQKHFGNCQPICADNTMNNSAEAELFIENCPSKNILK